MSARLQVLAATFLALSGPWISPAALAQGQAANVRVVPIPIANYTPLVVARDKNYFAEENLSVTWSPVAQGAVAIQAVFGGSAEVGGSAVMEPMVARGNGLDLMFLAGGNQIRKEPPDNSA